MQSNPRVLSARWVLPIASPPIRDGFVAIREGRIAAVGSAADLSADSFAGFEREELGEAILMPGFVNPHTHLELTCYAGKLPPAPFWDWIGGLIPLRREAGQVERESGGVRAGALLSLAGGVTTVGDISRRNLHWSVMRNLPIRKVCFVELLSIADDPPRTPDELRSAVIAAMGAEDDLLTVGVTPHAPYTVPAEHLRAAVELATELDRPWTTHWCETTGEIDFLRGELANLPPLLRRLIDAYSVASPGLAPMELLDLCVAHAAAGSLAHVNYLDDAGLAYLAMAGHAVIYCPRAHRFFGHPPHPMMTLISNGVPVAIGTDSAASNEGLSVLDELRFIHREVPNRPTPAELLRMGTIVGAKALRLEREIGSLEPGKWADLAVFRCGEDVADPVKWLLEGEEAAMAVFVAGERIDVGVAGSDARMSDKISTVFEASE